MSCSRLILRVSFFIKIGARDCEIHFVCWLNLYSSLQYMPTIFETWRASIHHHHVPAYAATPSQPKHQR
jgi:hypothetical protein